MANQFNSMPTYPVPLNIGNNTNKDWYFFWSGLFRGLAPGNVEPVTVGTSPYEYSATKRGSMIVSGGTVSVIEFSRDGTNYYDVGVTAGMFALNASDRLRVTYSVAPDMTFVPS
jgi:hypothetical protein